MLHWLFQSLINDHFGRILGKLHAKQSYKRIWACYLVGRRHIWLFGLNREGVQHLSKGWSGVSILLCLLARSTWLCSNFSDIFDVDHFIEALRGDVHVVKSLPREFSSVPKASKQFQSWSHVKYYEDTIGPFFKEYKVTSSAISDISLRVSFRSMLHFSSRHSSRNFVSTCVIARTCDQLLCFLLFLLGNYLCYIFKKLKFGLVYL